MLFAFKEFKKRRPNSALYLHMAVRDQGWDLTEVVPACGLAINEDVLFPGNNFGPNQGFPIDIVNKIYNASDVVASTTLGEGWGLSSVEAMACKTPVIFPNNTALTDIIGEDEERGFLVKSGETPDDYTIIPNDNEVLRPVTSVVDMAEKLLLAHDDRDLAKKKTEKAYKWLMENLIWEKHIVPQWDKLLTDAVGNWAKEQNVEGSVVLAEEL
jgi:glycosyltransferase involved in cell wall biosynthesis